MSDAIDKRIESMQLDRMDAEYELSILRKECDELKARLDLLNSHDKSLLRALVKKDAITKWALRAREALDTIAHCEECDGCRGVSFETLALMPDMLERQKEGG